MLSASISESPSILTVGSVILSCFGIFAGCLRPISSFKIVPIPPSENIINCPEDAKATT